MLKENCNIFLNKTYFNGKKKKLREKFQCNMHHQLRCHFYSTHNVIFRTVTQMPLMIKGFSRGHPPQLNPLSKGSLLSMWAGSWASTQPMSPEAAGSPFPAEMQRQCKEQLSPLDWPTQWSRSSRSSLKPGEGWRQQDGCGQQHHSTSALAFPTSTQLWIWPTTHNCGLLGGKKPKNINDFSRKEASHTEILYLT